MVCERKPSAAGFTLIEIVLAIFLLLLATSLVAATFGPWLVFTQGLQTERKLGEIQRALDAAYRDAAWEVDAEPEARLVLAHGAIESAVVADSNTFAPIEGYAALSAAQMAGDGFNMPHRVFVSKQIRRAVAGTILSYHVIAIVSMGKNGVLDAGTRFDAEQGLLRLGGDDKGVVIDGYPIARGNYEQTLLKLNKLAGIYQVYFQTRYLADTQRDAAVDYFAGACSGSSAESLWDGGEGAARNTCGTEMPLDPEESQRVFGMAPGDITDAFGQRLRLDNASVHTRNPENPTAGMSSPPYSAILSATLPGGVALQVSVVGSY
jgi:type II secretory pathway pseudopilin PulG